MKNNYVKLMADYSASGVWDAEGVMLELERLPISAPLMAKIHAWASWYGQNDDYLPAAERSLPAFPFKAFSAMGRELAGSLKAELPEWTVVYFDEYALAEHQGGRELRTAYEYEILSQDVSR